MAHTRIGSSRLFQFGEFDLDEPAFELRRSGVRLAVQPRPLQLLFYLVQNRNRVIGKQELFDRIWHDVIVSESALTSALRDVRRALGDDGRVPKMIQTLRNRGYRFVAPVEELPERSREPWGGGPDAACPAEVVIHRLLLMRQPAGVGRRARCSCGCRTRRAQLLLELDQDLVEGLLAEIERVVARSR